MPGYSGYSGYRRMARHPLFVLSALLAILLAGTIALAEPITFEREYRYTAIKADDNASAKTMALEHVKRSLFAALSQYLAEKAEVTRQGLSKETLEIMLPGLIRAEVLSEKRAGVTQIVRARLSNDLEELLRSLPALEADKKSMEQLRWVQKKTAEVSRDIKALGRAVEASKPGKTKPQQKVLDEKVEQYREEVKRLGSLDSFEEGLVAQLKGKDAEALAAYTRTLKVNPYFVRAHFNRGTVNGRLKSYKEAVLDYTRVIELVPDHTDAFVARGVNYHRLGEYKKALKDFDKAIGLNPKQPDGYAVRGLTYHKLGDYQLAVNDFTKLIGLNPQYADAYSMRGSSLFGLGDFRQAMEDHTKAIELDPRSAAAYFGRGAARYRLHELDKAIKDFDTAIELNPQYAEAYALRGASYGSLAMIEEANEDLKRAARLGDKDAQEFLRRKGIGWE
jgi:tetratricopeptide (TPR) repeat protein